MAPHSLLKLVALCIMLLAVSFAFLFLFSELPKIPTDSPIAEIHSPPLRISSTKEIRGEYSPPPSWSEHEQKEPEIVVEHQVLGVGEPVVDDTQKVGAEVYLDSIAANSVDSALVEEKLREQLVVEDPTWVSWQKMNQVRYLSLLTGQSFLFRLDRSALMVTYDTISLLCR